MDNTDKMPLTNYAPAELAPLAEVELSYHALKNNELLRMFQEAMPDLALIVNKNRQLVYANNNLIRFLDIEDSNRPLGKRLGNLLNCIHSNEQPSGCGTTDSCRFCGVVNAVIESQNSRKPVVKEARITATNDNEDTAYDLRVKASPLFYQDQEYTIICINDISDRKRRAVLEASLNNTASDLHNVVSSFRKTKELPESTGVNTINESVNLEHVNGLLAQKMLKDAEEGNLGSNVTTISSVQLLREMEEYFNNHSIAEGKRLFIDPFSHLLRFATDVNILKRVMINIITNAFEASDAGMTVRIGSKLNNTELRIWIHNQTELTEEAKHQMFQRSFSTKGSNRGLGTYSARLLVTRYLKGKISFKSDKTGTTFFIEVPLNLV